MNEALTIACPEIAMQDFELMQNFRKVNDRLYYKIVQPHFTVVFPLTGFSPAEFLEEIKNQTSETKPIPVSMSRCKLHKDALSNYFLLFFSS